MALTGLRDKIAGPLGRVVLAVVGVLIAGGFVFWNASGFSLGGPTFAAKVNGEKIPLAEFERDLQQQEAQFQQLYRIDLDNQMRRQIRRSVLDQLVQREALGQRVQSEGYRVSDQRLADSIRSIEAFQVGGEFNLDTYRTYLSYQGMSPAGFEALQRQQLELTDLQTGIADSSFLTPSEFRRYVELNNQTRRVGYAMFAADDFKDKVAVTDDEVASYYDEHKSQFMTEEAAGLEYVEISRADVAASINVTDEELEQYYEQHKDQFGTQEERHARHILITPKEGETEAETEARAQQVLERIQNGEDFATVAKEVSDDPGTAEQGGDLGWIGRGMLTGPFEDTLFDMKAGDVRGPVKTDFGWHIIRLDEIREGEVQPLDELRDTLLEQVRSERADARFYDLSTELADEAFDAYDELGSVAMKLNLPLKTAESFPRSGNPEVFANSAPVVDVVFGPDAIEQGLNSDLIKLSDDDVVVVNVTDRFPPTQKPLEAVNDEIRETLVRQRAAALAEEAAGAYMAALPETLSPAFLGIESASGDASTAAEGDAEAGDASSASEAADSDAGDASADAGAEGAEGAASPAAALAAEHGGKWVAPEWVERSSAELPAEILANAFQLPPPEGDAVARNDVALAAGGHAVILVAGVRLGRPETLSNTERDQARQEMIDRLGTTELGGYASTVREQAKVRVPQQVLEPQQF